MDIYASPKIKATVKKVGSLIALLFYSSLVDFYYIGPYIHNTLSLIKFFTEKTSVKSQDVEKNFLDINVILFDTISFFNGFNRNFVKDMKTFLERDVVYNERLFLNLRGISDSEHIMDICRQYSGGNEYSEIIKSGIIKPKIKSEEYIIIKPKPEDTIKVEQSETNMFRYLKYKKSAKKKMFLDEDINMMDFPEYIDDYERSLIKTNLAETLKIKQQESDILEVYDFINNITNTKTNKDEQNIINQNTDNFFEENKNGTINNKNNKANKNNEFDFLSMFNGGDKNKNNDENKKENENEKNKEKEEEYENIDSLFDFSQNPNNESTNSNKNEKKEEVKININTKDNKQSDKTENNKMLFNFDKFPNPNQSQISQKTKTGKKEEKNENIKENKSKGLIDDTLDNSTGKEGLKSMEKNNILVNNKNKSDEKANINSKKVNENQNQNLFDFNIFNSMNNNTNNNLNNNGFNFNKANFTNPKNNSTVNQKNPINNSLNFNFSNFGFNNNNQFGFFQQNEEGKIQVELKEEVCFYYNFKTGNKIINAMDKGYFGLLSEKEINKSKDFKINFLSKNFNNPQYIQKDSHIPTEKINDLNYKIKFNKMKKSEKLLEYIINPNILVKNRILEPFIGGEKNILKFGFMFNTNINKNIKKIDLSVIYKNTILNNNMIQCDGKIMNNTSNQILVSYNEKVKEAKITYPLNINVFSIVSKITIIITLENDVMSDFDVEIIDMKSKCLLENVKSAQIRYEFS